MSEEFENKTTYEAQSSETIDGKEGVRAFVDKDKARFLGK